LKYAASVIDATSPRIVQNYFIWHFMMDQSGNMPRTFRILKEQFDRVFLDIRDFPPRTVRCGYFVNNNMPFVTSKLYIKNYFDDSARNQVLKII
jgi:predicted metalloendopeptidase